MEKNVPQGDPLVSIRCLVYNHEPYLKQCLDGFVMQQTTFPFEAIVHDDASTDGSAAIIREYAEKYPHIIKPIYETENQYRKHDGSLTRIMDEAMHPGSKYVAMCEGDDYWTDPLKLQKQVDVMENDSEIGLVHTAARVFDQQQGLFKVLSWGEPIASFEAELTSNRVVTLTTCFRKDLLFKYRQFRFENYSTGWKMGDYPLWLYLSYYTKTHFIEQPTGVYRILQHSASHLKDAQRLADFEISAFNVKVFFAEHFNHEYKLKELATNLVYKLIDLSMLKDAKIKYDFAGLKRNYGLKNPLKLQVMHCIMQNGFLRHQYKKYLKFRTLKA